MKKWIGLLIGMGVLAAGFWAAQKYIRYTPPWAEPKWVKVDRGDILVPISASGLIQPEREIDVKSKASGEVIELRVKEGDFVRKGDVLIELLKVDEQRNVDRASAEKERSEIALAQARIDQLKVDHNITTAKARVEELAGQLEIAKFNLKVAEEAGVYTKQQMNDARQRVCIGEAQLESAQAALEITLLGVEEAVNAVKLSEKAVEVATTTLGDALQRLSETTIKAPEDAIVTRVNVRVGNLVQSATASFTGGTSLMTLAVVAAKKVLARVDEADYGRISQIAPPDALPDMPGLREAAIAEGDTGSRTGRVSITVDAFPEDTFEGVIERIEPQGKTNVGSSVIQYDVHVQIVDAKRQKLPLGAQAQVEFTVESAQNALRVPTEAVKAQGDERGVFLHVPPAPGSGEQWGQKFVACRFGISDGEYTQVVGGTLKEGAEVYTKLPPKQEN